MMPVLAAAVKKPETDQSKSVGRSDGGGESRGHESGRKMVEILDKTDYSSDDIDHTRRVVSHVPRGLLGLAAVDVKNCNWLRSLLNW